MTHGGVWCGRRERGNLDGFADAESAAKLLQRGKAKTVFQTNSSTLDCQKSF